MSENPLSLVRHFLACSTIKDYFQYLFLNVENPVTVEILQTMIFFGVIKRSLFHGGQKTGRWRGRSVQGYRACAKQGLDFGDKLIRRIDADVSADGNKRILARRVLEAQADGNVALVT